MKNLIRSTVAALLITVACMVHGAVPALSVTVSDASGKTTFKGSTDANGAFATAKLQPGKYVVQLNSKGAAKGNHYTIVVSAGAKKVSANAVPGEKFNAGGVALRVDVTSGLSITGQIAEEANGATKNGKKMVWIPRQLGSNMPGHWAEEGSAEAQAAKVAGTISTQDIQNKQNQGISPVGH